jgi:hypothetical protein
MHEAQRQNVVINSSGNYTAKNLASDEAHVLLNSTGSASIRVRNRLAAQLNSSGDLRYRGSPTVDAKTNSTGDVLQIGK